jgi:cytochrome c oxidase assembly protein subunit 11
MGGKRQPNQQYRVRDDHKMVAYYMSAIAVTIFGLSYASVPLYKVFCQMTGYGGTTQRSDELKASKVRPVDGSNVIRVDFASNVHTSMPWKFQPSQRSVKVVPGETALAFYTVRNESNKAITGVATYNVYPPKAGLYFNKVQCFCFEEQRLEAGEEIDMPVLFYIDPDFTRDPAMDNVKSINLSYTFFKTDEE